MVWRGDEHVRAGVEKRLSKADIWQPAEEEVVSLSRVGD